VFDNNATECENHYPADALGEMAQDEPEDLGFILVDETFKDERPTDRYSLLKRIL
jgi:hypothetical protein